MWQLGDDESQFRDAVRGLVEVQQVTVDVEKQQSPRDKLLEMTGGGEEDVATLKHVIEQKDEQIAVNQQELETNRQELTAKDEEIALLKAQLQQLQQPKEGVPPEWISVTYVNQ